MPIEITTEGELKSRQHLRIDNKPTKEPCVLKDGRLHKVSIYLDNLCAGEVQALGYPTDPGGIVNNVPVGEDGQEVPLSGRISLLKFKHLPASR